MVVTGHYAKLGTLPLSLYNTLGKTYTCIIMPGVHMYEIRVF